MVSRKKSNPYRLDQNKSNFTLFPPCSGRESKIDIPIALGWLFSNSLMARFNMKGTKGKTALEKTKVYIAIQDGLMTRDAAATESIIRMHAGEHLKSTTKKWSWRRHSRLIY
ncbi:hypothetical protein DPEC_G00018960 [Dallia pectoralis]|uniref:Uncharacterized protein n=1 Tax=Dallia pectoralis TaxID=75939 RepID=A0ACC2HFM4_DALPE|nr:hypothetical protein DPEC_G00018960 [Dallia pectoralis]